MSVIYMQIYKYTIMKTMYLPGYHHNGFVAADALRHIIIYMETRSDIETLSIDRVFSKENFYWKSIQKICIKNY